MVPNIEIIIGTYEEFLLGYKFDLKDEKPILVQSFADKSHSGSIKCLAVQGHWTATGSTDDRIFVYDMKLRKQTEIILSHEGTVNALTFTPDNTFLFSGGDDGRMIATHVGNWVTNAAWKKAHDGKSVTDIICHPSGKLALTLGSDLILRTWNLVKGRVAYKTNLKSRNSLGHIADCIAWSPTGDYFSLSGQRIIEIWSIQKADVVRSQKTLSKPTSVCWVNDENCIAGLEDGKIIWFMLKEDEKEVLIDVHETRVKAMVLHEDTLVTASSSGEIKVWQLNLTEKSLTQIAAINIGCRPTCLGVLDLQQFGTNYNLQTNVTETKSIDTKVQKKPAGQRCNGVVTIVYENDDDDNETESTKDASSTAVSSGDDDDIEEEEDEEEENSSDSNEESSAEEQTVQKKKRKIDQKKSKSPQISKQTNANKKSQQNGGIKIHKKKENVNRQKKK